MRLEREGSQYTGGGCPLRCNRAAMVNRPQPKLAATRKMRWLCGGVRFDDDLDLLPCSDDPGSGDGRVRCGSTAEITKGYDADRGNDEGNLGGGGDILDGRAVVGGLICKIEIIVWPDRIRYGLI